MRINVAINDFSPLALGPERLFRGLKNAGADGIELGMGFKSRWAIDYYRKLSREYDLPIVSVHQPMWSVVGLVFDEGAFVKAKELGVKTVTCHPLPKIGYNHPRMMRYFQRLAEVKMRTGLDILIENLPEKYNHPLLNKFFPPSEEARGVIDLYLAAKEFRLNLTLDTDHLLSVEPHKEDYFNTVYPSIKNIHLSSFKGESHHLPLYLGDFNTGSFIAFLNQSNYQGVLTLEIGYPTVTFFNYNFDAIKRSIELIRG